MTDQVSTAMGALRSLATTQVQVDVFSDQIIESVKNGEADPLEVLIQIRAFEKAADRILKEIRPNILTAADKFEEKTFTLYGNRLEKSESGVQYDYAKSDDPIWEQFDAAANTAIEQRKQREAFLRTIKASDVTKAVDPESGEEVTLKPVPKTSTSIVKVTIK